MTGLLDAFIAYKEQLHRDQLPDEVLAAVKTFTLDTMAVGIAGAAPPLTDAVRRAAIPWGVHGTAPLFGPGAVKVSAGSAAFINGFQIHCQEYDCVHEAAVVHPMATVFAALAADCTGRGMRVSGERFARAVALGVHVATTLGIAATSPIQFFRPANAGIFGATMGIALLRELSREKTLDAMGYALSFNAGTMQAHVEGKPALPVQIGNAARGSIMACDLAEAGMAGTRNTLEGPFGYFKLFEKEVDLTDLATSFASRNRVVDVSHKPFPTGRAAHGGIVLMQQLRSDIRHAEDIEAIELSAPPLIERLVGRPMTDHMAANYARLCFPFLGAVTFQTGGVSLHSFADESFGDHEIRALAKKIRVTTNDVTDPAAFIPQTLTATMKDGSSKSFRTESLYGSAAHPMSESEQRAKVADCLSFGFGEDARGQAEALWSRAMAMEELHDINELIEFGAVGPTLE